MFHKTNLASLIFHILFILNNKNIRRVEALVSGHGRDAKKVPVTGAGRLRECKNTEFVWEVRKTRFCEGGLK